MRRVVWITGAGSGIGETMARRFADAGFNIRHRTWAEAALERMGEGLHAFTCRIDDARGVNLTFVSPMPQSRRTNVTFKNATGNLSLRVVLAIPTLGRGHAAMRAKCRNRTTSEAAKALSDLGIATEGLGSFERPVSLLDGTQGVAAFSTVAFTSEEVPFGTVFMCQNHMRETVWLPELIEHPNSGCGLNAILAVSEHPQQDADAFARLWANSIVAKTTTGHPTAQGLAVVPPDAFGAIIGFVVK